MRLEAVLELLLSASFTSIWYAGTFLSLIFEFMSNPPTEPLVVLSIEVETDAAQDSVRP